MEKPLVNVAVIHSDFTGKFGIPRQSGLCPEVISRIVFEKPYRSREALRGIEGFSHLWLLWDFSESHTEDFRPTVRPPRLGGNTRMGVFATRSPYRPNPIGLSCVKLERVDYEDEEGPVLYVSGADLMDGTPILDIKPYLPLSDAVPDAKGGFAEDYYDYSLTVLFPEELACRLPSEKREAVKKVLSLDPRPSYQNDPERVYGMEFSGYDIRFKVFGKELTVVGVCPKGRKE